MSVLLSNSNPPAPGGQSLVTFQIDPATGEISAAYTAGGSSSGGVNSQTANYLAVSGDNGKIISMSGSSLTLTLPAAPPSTKWFIFIANLDASTLTVSRNGLLIDGAASDLSIAQNQGVYLSTDGTNYFTERGEGSASGVVTATGSPASGNLTKFSGTASITNGDLSGDVATTSTLVTTIQPNAVTTGKINAAAVTEAKIGLSAVTTNDVSTTKHGFAPVLPNDATKFLNGVGGYTVPPGAGVATQQDIFTQIKGYVALASGTAAAQGFTALGTLAPNGTTFFTDNVYTIVPATTSDLIAISTVSAAASGRKNGLWDGISGTTTTTSLTTAGTKWWKARCAISPLASSIFFAGVSNIIPNTTAMIANPSTSLVAAFRYVGGTDTNWQCYTSNGAASTVTDSGVAADTNPHEFQIVFNGGTSLDFYIDGVKVATVTLTLPSNSTTLSPFIANTTSAATATTTKYYYMWWASASN